MLVMQLHIRHLVGQNPNEIGSKELFVKSFCIECFLSKDSLGENSGNKGIGTILF